MKPVDVDRLTVPEFWLFVEAMEAHVEAQQPK